MAANERTCKIENNWRRCELGNPLIISLSNIHKSYQKYIGCTLIFSFSEIRDLQACFLYVYISTFVVLNYRGFMLTERQKHDLLGIFKLGHFQVIFQITAAICQFFLNFE